MLRMKKVKVSSSGDHPRLVRKRLKTERSCWALVRVLLNALPLPMLPMSPPLSYERGPPWLL